MQHFLILQVAVFLWLLIIVVLTFKVEAERAYHQRVLEILDQLEEEVYMLSALLFEQIYILVCCVGTVSVNSKARRIFYLLV